MNNNIFIFTIGCIILFCVILSSHRSYKEHFGLIDDINKAINNVANVGQQMVSVASKIPTEAERFAKSAVDFALKPAKDGLGEIKNVFDTVDREVKKMFEVIKDIFDKIKYFSDLLIIMLKRSQKCATGAAKIVKNYTARTKDVISKINIARAKMLICPTNPFLDMKKYWQNCISQILPFLKLAFKYTIILKRFYSEVLTYPELFPQGSDVTYCSNHWTQVTSQNAALDYAKKCNTCLHIKSIIKLGVEELQEFAGVIGRLFEVSDTIEREFSKITGIIKI